MTGPALPYRYLNAEALWPTATTTGLERDADGVLRLASLPGGASAIDAGAASALTGPAGVAVAPDGTVYVVDPPGHRVLRIDACDGSRRPLSCLAGPGDQVGELDTPRGAVVGPHGRVYVADSGNGRIQVVDPDSGTVTAVFAGLGDPRDLALDAGCNLYVVDEDAAALVKLDREGRRDTAFETAIAALSPPLSAPACVAVLANDDRERLLVVDAVPQGARLVVLGLDGALEPAATTTLAAIVLPRIAAAGAHGGTLYVAAPHGVLAFDLAGGLLGLVAPEPAASLALDARGRLVVHGTAGTTRRGAGDRASAGRLLLGPLAPPPAGETWDRVRLLLAEPLADDAHVRAWTLTTAAAGPPPTPSGVPPDAEPIAPAAPDSWRAAPRDSTDLLVLNAAAPFLWIAVELFGERGATPALEDVRVDVVGAGRRDLLPSLYAEEPSDEMLRHRSGGELTRRFIALLGSALDDLDAEIDDLALLLDPHTAPDLDRAGWLEVLADRVAMPLDADWSDERRRSLVAGAFDLHGRRGTRAGLEEVLGRYVRAPVTITEPAAHASAWSLGVHSTLGFTSMLTPAPAQGSVLDRTAEVDRSHLIGDDDRGWPLFADLAHRFCVTVHRADLCSPASRALLEAVIERERPAHTRGHLCVLEPRTLVGAQARVGIDLIVGPAPPPHTEAGARVGVTTRIARADTDRGGHRHG